jgi:hypothetical protein
MEKKEFQLRLKNEEYNKLNLLADESLMSKTNFIRLSIEFYYKHYLLFKQIENIENYKSHSQFENIEKEISNDIEIICYSNYNINEENFNRFLMLMEKINKGYIINKKRKFVLKIFKRYLEKK